MGITLSGLTSSGLDVKALVADLMKVESIPQLNLQAKVKLQRTEITALQDLNTRIAALAKSAKDLTSPNALAQFKATSSSDAVAVTAKPAAGAGTIDLVVDSVAAGQKSVTGAMSTAPGTKFTITDAKGAHTEVTAASSSLDDVVTALNGSDTGVRAVKVSAGTDPGTGEKLYRLQLTSTETGAENAFSFHAGTAAEVDGGTATDLLTAPGAATVTAAADSKVRLWAGTPAEQTVTSSTAVFTDLLPGVDVTVAKASANPVTITVNEDTEARTATVKGFVDSVQSILSRMAALTKVTIAADGSTTGATLAGESVVRNARQMLTDAASYPIDGESLSAIGIEITRTGEVVFDPKKLDAALAADPNKVTATFNKVAARVQEAAESLSDKYDGQLTTSIQNRETNAKRMDEQIVRWDTRLEQRYNRLSAQFTSMEVQLAKLDSQQQWLTGQLNALNPSKR
ncbi:MULTISPECIES: flagellar filament capping protein FliD [Oerskovia]|uniref:Flagellar hook-associated protein 2 n=2 Tax=Oerskovia TaxID=162491 RepID=A0ABR8V560_9CELL|nr:MULTISPECIES: flagellar filament capping protein FliD [Oerskovia]MBD7999927.1 flagellar filament capping protein FliD [Oerskovia gallyi]MBM7496272.1 flagellar hook-associated protein 2 [Oerskovia paurometabola]